MLLDTALDLRNLRQRIAAMYDGAGREAGHLRALQLLTVLRLTPYAMLCNLGGALLVWWSFQPAPPPGMAGWVAAMVLVTLLATHNWWRNRRRSFEVISSRAAHRATRNAVLLSLAWSAMLLLWFPQAGAPQQLALAALFTGMLGAGTFMLSPLPYASIAYAAIHTAAALLALWRTGDAAFLGVAALLALYAPMVVLGSLAGWRKATALIASQKEAQRQERMLAVLLQDFEQHADEALWETGPASTSTTSRRAWPSCWASRRPTSARRPSCRCSSAARSRASRRCSTRSTPARRFATSASRCATAIRCAICRSTASACSTSAAVRSAGAA